MKDLIVGRIKSIIDCDLLHVEVTQVVRKSNYEYGPEERIHIMALLSEDSGVLERINSSPLKVSLLRGRGVMCLVHSRKPGGKIDAEVFILPEKVPHGGDEAAQLNLSEGAQDIFLVEGGESR